MSLRRAGSSIRRFAVCLLLAAGGCATPATRAARHADGMLDPSRTPLERLRSQAAVVAMGDAADAYLPDAFFAVGLYDVPKQALPLLAEAGFNLAVNADKDDPELLACCERLGIRLVPYIRLGRMQEDVRKAQGEDALWGWYLFDEPDLHKKPPEFIRTHYRALRQADPTRPIYLTVLSPRRYADFIESCDVFAPNPYPIVHVDATKNQLRWVAMAADAARKRAKGQVIWLIIQAFWAEPWWQRNPTPAELRAMVYLALNHGAKGIVYFSYKSGDRPITEHKKLFAMIRQVNAEIRALKPALLRDPLPDAVDASLGRDERGGLVVGRPRLGAADCALRRYRGRWLLTVVNPDPWAKQVYVRLQGAASRCAEAVELFTDEAPDPHPAVGGLVLPLRPFQVRVLELLPDAPQPMP